MKEKIFQIIWKGIVVKLFSITFPLLPNFEIKINKYFDITFLRSSKHKN